MPYYRRKYHTRRRFGRRRFGRGRVGPSIGRAPRWGFRQRRQQNLTRLVQYFKNVQTIASDNLTDLLNYGVNSRNVADAGEFQTYATLYSEYKVLKISVKYIPANVGGESTVIGPSPGGNFRASFVRGDAVTWVDTDTPQPPLPPFPVPASIEAVINKSSARIIQPRRTHYRWVNRSRGYPTWGKTDNAGNITAADLWQPSLRMYGTGFTPSNVPGIQNYFYVMVTFKVLFRSRQE